MAEIASMPSDAEEMFFLNRLVWIKDPLDPSLNRHWRVQEKWLRVKTSRPSDDQTPIETALPIVTTDGTKGDTFSLTFLLLGNEEWLALKANVIESVKTLLVQAQRSQWYVQVVNDVNREEHLWDHVADIGEEEARTVAVSFMEVEAP